MHFNSSIEKETQFLTPEQVRLRYRTAGLGSRAIAHLIDVLLLIAASALILFGAAGIVFFLSSTWFPNDGYDYLFAGIFIFLIVLNVGYFIVMEAYWGGQTIGKKAVGLRVLMQHGQSATILPVVIRNLFRLLDFLPMGYFAGGVAILFSRRDNRIGDMVAGTIVVAEASAEHRSRRSRIDKRIAAMQKRGGILPDLELADARRALLQEQDWHLLQGWADRMDPSPKTEVSGLEQRIWEHFTLKLGHERTRYSDIRGYLAALYLAVREDWEL
ncbi:RDD family protein [Paenibacillus pasadenensis]|uniref:RDD family protein n=1 Tax=Paenibacillus pasadenensis TaxID=217090 RepID=UPI00203AA17A|nr:RDD family protein [Paenibacillus pasadenensis]MCM3748727.1 RDD family protein [Paenibacillus pasadenensis]